MAGNCLVALFPSSSCLPSRQNTSMIRMPAEPKSDDEVKNYECMVLKWAGGGKCKTPPHAFGCCSGFTTNATRSQDKTATTSATAMVTTTASDGVVRLRGVSAARM